MEKFEEMEDEINLIDVINVLIKKKKLIIGGTLICFVGALLIAFLKPPPPKVFQASFTVRVGKIANDLIDPIDVVKSTLENDYLLEQNARSVNISISEKGQSVLDVKAEAGDPSLGKAVLESLKRELLNDHDKLIKKYRAGVGKKVEFVLRKIEILKVSNKALSKELSFVKSNKSVRAAAPSLVFQLQNKLTGNAFQLAGLEETLMQHKTEVDSIQDTKVLQKSTTIEMPVAVSKKKLIVILGVVAGMMLSIFLAFFLEFIENNKNQWEKSKG